MGQISQGCLILCSYRPWPQGVQGVIDMTKRPTRVLSEDDEDDEEEYGDRPRETRSKEPLSKGRQ